MNFPAPEPRDYDDGQPLSEEFLMWHALYTWRGAPLLAAARRAAETATANALRLRVIEDVYKATLERHYKWAAGQIH